MLKKLFVTSAMCAAAFAAAPATASADWVITPFVGWNFGGSADDHPMLGPVVVLL